MATSLSTLKNDVLISMLEEAGLPIPNIEGRLIRKEAVELLKAHESGENSYRIKRAEEFAEAEDTEEPVETAVPEPKAEPKEVKVEVSKPTSQVAGAYAVPEKIPSKKVRLIFHSERGKGGNAPIFFRVNDRTLQAKREVEVVLDREFFDVLKNAVVTEYMPDPEHEDKMLVREVSRFSYTYLGEAE